MEEISEGGDREEDRRPDRMETEDTAEKNERAGRNNRLKR